MRNMQKISACNSGKALNFLIGDTHILFYHASQGLFYLRK